MEYLTLLLNALALFVIAFQAAIYRKQLSVMQELKAISERQAGTFDSQAEKMQGQLSEMKAQATAMQETLAETRNIVAQNERVVSAVEIQAKVAEQGLTLAQENALHTLRAYVNIRSMDVALIDGAEVKVTMEIVNFGNTPAINVQIFAKVEVRDAKLPTPAADINLAAWEGGGTSLAPSMPFIHIAQTDQPITNQQIGLLFKDDIKVFVWGIVQYKDILNKERYTKFAYVYMFRAKKLALCGSGNEAT